MIKAIVNGACGQMGRTIAQQLQENPKEYQLIAGISKTVCPETGLQLVKDIRAVPAGADILFDFSHPNALPPLLDYCTHNGVRLVMGTTGIGESERQMLQNASVKIPIFYSGNMSIGVSLQIELIKKAATLLGGEFDIEITEKHHRKKLDSPSGTALMLANALNDKLSEPRQHVYGRHCTDCRRTKNEIGIHAIRGGTITGEHDVEFFGTDETISISHKAYSRRIFALGALRAGQFLMHQQPGLYDMGDLLSSRETLSRLYTEDGQAVITVSSLPHESETLGAVFGAIAGAGVFVDMISMTAPSGMAGEVSFSLPQTQLQQAKTALKSLRPRYMGMDIYALESVTKLTIEDPRMAHEYGIAGKLFVALAQEGVRIELVTTSETKISCCVRNEEVAEALDVIARQFDL